MTNFVDTSAACAVVDLVSSFELPYTDSWRLRQVSKAYFTKPNLKKLFYPSTTKYGKSSSTLSYGVSLFILIRRRSSYTENGSGGLRVVLVSYSIWGGIITCWKKLCYPLLQYPWSSSLTQSRIFERKKRTRPESFMSMYPLNWGWKH